MSPAPLAFMVVSQGLPPSGGITEMPIGACSLPVVLVEATRNLSLAVEQFREASTDRSLGSFGAIRCDCQGEASQEAGLGRATAGGRKEADTDLPDVVAAASREPVANLLHRPRPRARRRGDLRFLRARRDRLCPARTAGPCCHAAPARTSVTMNTAGSGPSVSCALPVGSRCRASMGQMAYVVVVDQHGAIREVTASLPCWRGVGSNANR